MLPAMTDWPLALTSSLPSLSRRCLGWLFSGLCFASASCSRPFLAYSVASGSMAPTLQVGDRVFSAQNAYNSEPPQRGDIVVFTTPPALEQAGLGEDILISRVVGLPGEELAVQAGQTLINQSPLSEPYIEEPADYELPPIIIPEDAVFVFSDNRNNAFDSHAWGPLPQENIIGKVQLIYWPPGRYGSVYEP
ncbi:MAG: signal peptidase I [Cyanobacteria bacterium P01_D01_bin.71]